MPNSIKILLAQINPIVGGINTNLKKITNIIESNSEQYDLIAFPELALTGYPLDDLLLRDTLYEQTEIALDSIRNKCNNDCRVIIGHPSRRGKHYYNSASIFVKNQCINTYNKQCLPNFGVFDEKRYFTKGKSKPCIFSIKDTLFGLCICEDIWHAQPLQQILKANVKNVICINASPFSLTNHKQREEILLNHAKSGVNIFYVNQVGGQDELVFDGQSVVIAADKTIKIRAAAFEECVVPVTFSANQIFGQLTPVLEKNALIYKALCCGLHDYVMKNKFPGVIIGVSGGIDSALTLALAVDALGADKVHAVFMPSRFTAEISKEDALAQIEKLQVKYSIISIEDLFVNFLSSLSPLFENKPIDVTEQNLQARIRGVLLMALSNKFGYMVLTTSNKSETAVGYATLYGDTAGGFAVLKDIYKTTVYELATYRNSISQIIPERVITRAPTAELAANQKDQDSLPPYEILDEIIMEYVENNTSSSELIRQGFDKQIVNQVVSLLSRNEYKRRQTAPGVKITPRIFGKDWRYPITSEFKDIS